MGSPGVIIDGKSRNRYKKQKLRENIRIEMKVWRMMMKKRVVRLLMMMEMTFCLMGVMMAWMVESNGWMKLYNGNIRTNGKKFVDLCYQNIPLGLSLSNKEDIIDRLLHS